MKFQVAFKELLQKLQESPAETPVRELRVLMSHVLGISQEQLLFDPPEELSTEDFQSLSTLIERRCQHEPLAKIVGHKEFWGLKFKVTADTLDPRPDSEVLIETLLSYCPNRDDPIRLLDLGTGSGCLILSALSEFPHARGVAIDFSPKVLAVAQENSLTLGLNDRCEFKESNWFSHVDGQFDVILANPPYIDRAEVLSRQTLYDPQTALFADEKGLADYKLILASARSYLKLGGVLILEIGYNQSDLIENIAKENGFDLKIKSKDFNQLDRCLVFS